MYVKGASEIIVLLVNGEPFIRCIIPKLKITKIKVGRLSNIQEVLVALRRVIRATDLHSKYLAKTTGLTAPQILILQTIRDKGLQTVGSLAKDVSLSQATVTNILDRLEAKELVVRERSAEDKRKVFTQLTAKARVVLEGAPLPLQDQFARQFEELQQWEQAMMISALQRIAQMMDAETIDAAPVLDVGLLDRQAPATDNPAVSSDD